LLVGINDLRKKSLLIWNFFLHDAGMHEKQGACVMSERWQVEN
jgi:hypothetical protein